MTADALRRPDTPGLSLEHFRRCQALSPRPNFAVLLGDRCGRVPARIPESCWARLISAAEAGDRADLELSAHQGSS